MLRRKSWFKGLRRFLGDERSFGRDDGGTVLIYVTLGLTVFLGFSALAIDGSYLYFMSNRAQTSADAAALAGVSQLEEGDEVVRAEAIDFAAKNLTVASYGNVLQNADVDIGTWNSGTRVFTDGATPADAVQVVVRMDDTNSNPLQLFFAAALGSPEGGVAALAVATLGGGESLGENCLQALNPEAENAFRVVGTADITAEGCNIQIDSCHESAAFVAGDPSIDLTVELDDGGTGSGSINICGGMFVTEEADLPPEQYVNDNTGTSAGDPFDRSPFDEMPSAEEIDECDETDFTASDESVVTLSPGVYCGGISLSGNQAAEFEPGTYYIKDGEFKTTGSWDLSGEGVTFVMTGAASNLELGGTASMAFSAPLTGDYAGFVFFGDPNNPATDPHKLHGTPLGAFHGIAYFPEADVRLLGTVGGELPGGTSDCSVLIADTFFLNGTIELNLASECTDFQGTEPFLTGPLTFRLVD
jgi:Flp pilus assembly protein TadG